MKRIIVCFPDSFLDDYEKTRKSSFADDFKAQLLYSFKSKTLKSYESTLNQIVFELAIDKANEEIKSLVIEALKLNEKELRKIKISIYTSSNTKNGNASKENSNKSFVDYINKLDLLKKELKSKVYGQYHAIDVLTSGLINQFVFNKQDRLQTYTFCGPHGVGKTHMASIVTRFFKEEFNIPNLTFNRDSYEDNDLFSKIKRFVGNNPQCFIVFNDAEEFYNNIDDALRIIFNSNSYKNVSFKKVTFIFTTCLGRPIYSSSLTGNLSNVSQESILNAFLTEKIPDANIGQLSNHIAKQLAKGTCIMFNFLDPYTIKEIIEEILTEKFDTFTKATGIKVNYDKQQIATAVIYGNTGEYNVISLSKKLDAFIQDELNDIFSQTNPQTNTPILSNLKKINFDFSFDYATEDVKKLFDERTLTGLVIANQEEVETIKSLKIKNITFEFASNIAEARSMVKNNVDFIIIDVLLDLDNLDNMPTNIDDYDNEGMKLFNHIINYYNEPALYILNNEKLGKKYDDYAYLVANGAKDILLYSNKKSSVKELELLITRIQKSIELDLDISYLITNKKILMHNSKQFLSSDGLTLDVLFSKLSLMYSNHNYTNSSLIYNNINSMRFDDLIGNQHAVKVLKNYASFLKNPTNYLKQSIKPPKGVLLCGSKGIGKKSLINALVNETNVSFIHQNIESLVNDTNSSEELTKAIHELFVKAKSNSPSILFFDSVDYIVTDTQSITMRSIIKFLNGELDTINNDEKHPVVFICTADVNKEYLNDSFLNKLDRIITMNYPTIEERKKYIKRKLALYSLNSLSEAAITNFAARMYGSTLGQINNIIDFIIKNSHGDEITDKAVIDAIDAYEIGDENIARSSPEDDLRTAYHEVGHLLIDILCGNHPTFVTIVSRGDYGGYTYADPKENATDRNKQEYLDRICLSFGGRAAETLIYGDIGVNSGASSDLQNATLNARRMVCYLGMGDTLISLRGLDETETPKYMIEEMDKILHEQYERCYNLLKENKGLLDFLTNKLVEAKFLTGDEIEKLVIEYRTNNN